MIESDRNPIFLQIIPMHIASIIIGFAIGACASGIIVYVLVQRRRKEGAVDNKIAGDQVVDKLIPADTDNIPLVFTLDEVGKIIFGEDEDGQISESFDDGYDDLLTSQPIHK
jgi:hypothetical protein